VADVQHETTATIKALNVQKRRTVLLKRIFKFREAQIVFMPGLRSYLLTLGPDNPTTSRPEDITLHLPSSIPTLHRLTVCSPGLVDIEDQLRYAHAIEASVSKSGLQNPKKPATGPD
jgi:hypothetical protein